MASESPILNGELEESTTGQELSTVLAQQVAEQKESEYNIEQPIEQALDTKDTTEGDSKEMILPILEGSKKDLKDVLARYHRTPNDTNDPSYTGLTLPYSVLCRQRYHRAQKYQNDQFIREIRIHELLRDRALDGVRIHREFCNPVIKHVSAKELITLTKRQQERLNRLLED